MCLYCHKIYCLKINQFLSIYLAIPFQFDAPIKKQKEEGNVIILKELICIKKILFKNRHRDRNKGGNESW